MRKILFLALVFIMTMSACRPTEMTNTSIEVASISIPVTTTASSWRTATVTPTATQLPTEIRPTATTSALPFEVCTPLEDETFESLQLILKNPLNIPEFGRDTGHHGVDFYYYRRGDRESIQGIKIYAILAGKTVLTLDDDRPYGYTILIETPITDLPDHLQETLMAGYLPVPEDPHYRLNCPEVTPPTLTGDYSVYHLYAHMEIRPSINTGDPVACGQTLGTVGNTGDSSNPHLHLETRLGPSGAEFTTMAHYEPTNTIEQISNYCLWRMSGYYQLFDPFILFDAAE